MGKDKTAKAGAAISDTSPEATPDVTQPAATFPDPAGAPVSAAGGTADPLVESETLHRLAIEQAEHIVNLRRCLRMALGHEKVDREFLTGYLGVAPSGE